MKCKYRIIVSVDGGGIRGVIPLKLIDHIQKAVSSYESNLDVPSWVDLFSATSTGSIICGALMLKDEHGKSVHNPEDMISLFIERGHQIFAKGEHGMSNSENYPLNFVLEHYFGNTTLDKIDRHFLFVSYDLNADEPFFFTDTMDRMRTISLSKVLKACSAFPGVFPPVHLGNRILADGTISTKNPAKLAYHYARLYYPNDPIIVISLGTGIDLDVKQDIFETEGYHTHHEMQNLANEDKNLIYFRFQPKLHHSSSNYNDASRANTEALLDDAIAYIHTHEGQFDRLFSLMRIRAEQYY